MHLIHVDTEYLQEAGISMYYQADDMGEIISGLRMESQRLNMAWYGNSSDEFVKDLSELLASLHQNIEALSKLSYILRREADVWNESDIFWSDHYQEQLIEVINKDTE